MKIKTRIHNLLKGIYYNLISNNIILSNKEQKTIPNKVNLHYWDSGIVNGSEFPYNLGDNLSIIIVEAMLAKKGLSLNINIDRKKHLYAVGSILTMGYQNATIWGSGLLEPLTKFERIFHHFPLRKLDIRCVRGPLSRESIIKLGYTCPKVYGDPAILMPYLFPCAQIEDIDYIIIPHFRMESIYRRIYGDNHIVSMITDDYMSVISRICRARKVISGSLHGIILAESYGKPTIWLRDRDSNKDFKYKDYYYSTERENVVFATTIEDAISMEPMRLPSNLAKLQKDLIDSFPYDLWS